MSSLSSLGRRNTMLVELKQKWFAPSTYKEIGNTRRFVSGQKFDKGVQEIDSELRPFLPHSAVILDQSDVPMEEVLNSSEELYEADHSRAAGENYHKSLEAQNESEQKRIENMQAQINKSRAARRKNLKKAPKGEK